MRTMKIKDGFVMRQMAGRNLVLPSGDDLDRNMMITLNGTGAFLWEQMQSDTDEAKLAAALMAKYGVDEKTAVTAVEVFLEQLRSHDFLA